MPKLTKQPRATVTALVALAMLGSMTGCSDRDAVLSEKIAAADAAARRAEAAATRAEAAAKRVSAGAPVSESTEAAEPEIDDGPDTVEADTTSDNDSNAAG